jgi:hypothetical protein
LNEEDMWVEKMMLVVPPSALKLVISGNYVYPRRARHKLVIAGSPMALYTAIPIDPVGM